MRKPNFLAQLTVLGVCAAGLLGMSVSASAQSSPPHERSASYRYDGVGRMVGEIAPDPDGSGPLKRPATRTTYDPNGLVIRVETGTLDSWQSNSVAPKNWSGFNVLQTVENSYDTLGQLVKAEVVGEDNVTISVVQSNYDRAGRPGCSAVRMNRAAFNSLPASACTLGTQGSEGPDRITRNFYDTAGQMLQMRMAVGTSVEIAEVTYSYTLNGQIKQVVDANGNKAEMVYDGFDRQVEWRFPSKVRPAPGTFNDATPATAMASAGAVSANDKEVYTYDNNGNRKTLLKRDGSLIEYDYDALNRMTRKTIPDDPGKLDPTHTRDVFYDYDLLDRPLRTRFDSINGPGQRNFYDGFSRITRTEDNTIGALRALSYQYDKNSNRTHLTYPDNAQARFTYDLLDRLDRVRQGGATLGGMAYNQRGLPSKLEWPIGASSINERTYDYDPAGRLDEIGLNLHSTSHDVTWDYTRNSASQIRTETQSNDSYSWDGHIDFNRNYATNGLNQYTSAGSDTLTYDANGNLTSDGQTTFLYDVENRLVRATRASSTTELYYDPLGRLYKISDTSMGTTHFLHDGNALVMEIGASGQILRRYVHGSNVSADDPLIWYEGPAMNSTGRRYVHADPRGSIVAVTNRQGSSIATNTYDEYGIPDEDTQMPSGDTIAEKGRFRYTGQAWLPELGMYYYKARIYSPTLGRFLQTDPIGYEDQYNLYAYVGNDPINAVDPTGEVGVVGAFVGGGLEVLTQAATGELQEAWGEGYDRLADGDIGGAFDAVKASGAKILISSGSGALGVGIAGQATKATISVVRTKQVAQVARASGAGATAAAVERAGHNVVSGRNVADGIGEAAIGGAAGSGLARRMGQNSAQRSISQPNARVRSTSNGHDRGHTRHVAARESQRAANRTELRASAMWGVATRITSTSSYFSSDKD